MFQYICATFQIHWILYIFLVQSYIAESSCNLVNIEAFQGAVNIQLGQDYYRKEMNNLISSSIEEMLCLKLYTKNLIINKYKALVYGPFN